MEGEHLCVPPAPVRRGDWMQTYTGRQYWPLDPRPDEVTAEDIAHHLGMLCRYCGACRRFYSVAEHSVGVLRVLEGDIRRELSGDRAAWRGDDLVRRYKLAALLHDAPEAYCHDLIRPIKRCVEGYAGVERANADAIALRFNLPLLSEIDASRIKHADNAMLLAEQEAIMAPAPAKWSPLEVPAAMLHDAGRFLREQGTGWGPIEAGEEFLAAWRVLA